MPLIVTALQPQRFRAGRRFTDTPTEIADGVLTADEEAALRADPRLLVDTVADAAERNARIDAIIQGLHVRDVTADGKPKVDALNEVLKVAELAPVDAAERDAAVVRLIGAGWTAPTDPDA